MELCYPSPSPCRPAGLLVPRKHGPPPLRVLPGTPVLWGATCLQFDKCFTFIFLGFAR